MAIDYIHEFFDMLLPELRPRGLDDVSSEAIRATTAILKERFGREIEL